MPDPTAPPPEYNPPATGYGPPPGAGRRPAMPPVGYRARQLVWLAVGIVNAILALRFIFIAMEAHDTGFVSAINQAGGALAYPFQGIFGITSIGGHPMQWACVLAIVIYTIAAWVVNRVVVITASHNRGAPIAY